MRGWFGARGLGRNLLRPGAGGGAAPFSDIVFTSRMAPRPGPTAGALGAGIALTVVGIVVLVVTLVRHPSRSANLDKPLFSCRIALVDLVSLRKLPLER
jgi:hypothetical protein